MSFEYTAKISVSVNANEAFLSRDHFQNFMREIIEKDFPDCAISVTSVDDFHEWNNNEDAEVIEGTEVRKDNVFRDLLKKK